jgi:hypothetical protein
MGTTHFYSHMRIGCFSSDKRIRVPCFAYMSGKLTHNFLYKFHYLFFLKVDSIIAIMSNISLIKFIKLD